MYIYLTLLYFSSDILALFSYFSQMPTFFDKLSISSFNKLRKQTKKKKVDIIKGRWREEALRDPLKSWGLRPHSSPNCGEKTFPPTRKMAAPLLEQLSESLGSPEPAIRLILSILIGEFLPTIHLQVVVAVRGHHTNLYVRCELLLWWCNC